MVRPVISLTRAAVSYSRISSIRFLRDLAVVPVKAARTARVSGSVRYSMGVLGVAGARSAWAAWLSATRVMSSWDE